MSSTLNNGAQNGQNGLVGIVGMACRVPGATNIHEFWQLMKERRDLRRKMPADRFNVDGFYHPNGPNKGTLNAPYGYFLDQNLGDFDAGFFGISPKEAEAMDPQQRLALEVVYEALEDAGIPFPDLAGSRTSVYCGSFTNDYGKLIDRDMASYPKYTVTGTGQTILSNRISYFYDFHGESMTVDTACSSSLICLHLGAQSLRNGESDTAIVVGSALHFDPNMFITMADFGMLSPDGRSRSFDANGKGYARGEGMCVVVLKRLQEAEQNNDRIHAVVRATGANHDGTKNGITLPNPVAQEALIRQVYKKANISTKDTAYFEAHGTGTKAGDPREARAVGAVFGNDGRSEPLHLGSVKSIIGHLEGAAGLAAVIKAALSVKHGKIAPNMHFVQPNPEIDFKKWNLSIPTEMIDWPANYVSRRASINSFGYGGSNCHVVVEAYTKSITASSSPTPSRRYLLPISAHSEKVGKKAAAALHDYLLAHPDVDLANLAYTLSQHRAMHEKRSFVSVMDASEAASLLAETEKPLAWTTAKPTKRLGFVFTGQGAQWAQMGASLLDASPAFRDAIAEYDRIIQSLPDRPDWSVAEELRKTKEESQINKPQFSQPICTAVQLGLLAQLSEWGIKPSATVGHSSGEVAAAYAAGLISFSSAVVISYYRGKYTSQDESKDSTIAGGMLAVGMTEAEAEKALRPYVGRICVAAINSPSSLTLSGDLDAVNELKEELTQKGVFARSLVVKQAYHSHHMLPFSAAYLQAMEGYAHSPPTPSNTTSMVSSVVGRTLRQSMVEPQYWVNNLTSAVRFSDALTETVLDELDQVKIDALVEIGPHPALKGPVRQTLASLDLDIPHVGTLARGADDFQSLLTTAGQLYSLGYAIDLAKVNDYASHPRQRVEDLPTYRWDHGRYWAQTRLATAYLQRGYRHPLLGALQPDSTDQTKRWRNYLRLKEIPWLAGHKVEGRVIFPAAGYLSLAAEAACRITDVDSVELLTFQDVHIKAALEIANGESATEVITELRDMPNGSGSEWQFIFSSFDTEGNSRQHCRGILSVASSTAELSDIERYSEAQKNREKPSRAIPDERFYRKLQSLGLDYTGPFKRLIGTVESQPGFATAGIEAASDVSSSVDCILDPGFLDATLHPVFAAVEAELGRPITQPFLPVYLNSLKIAGPMLHRPLPEDMRVFSCSNKTATRSLKASTHVHTESGQPLIALEGLELRALGADESANDQRSLFQQIRWRPSFDLLDPAKSPEVCSSITVLLDTFAHQHPDASVLIVASGLDSTKDLLMNGFCIQLGKRKRYKDITIVSETPSASEEISALVAQEKWPSILVSHTIQSEESYDLIVLVADQTVSSEMLRKNGTVIRESTVALDTRDLVRRFQHGTIECWKKTQPSGPTSALRSIACIIARSPSQRTKETMGLLQKRTGSSMKTTTFSELSPEAIQALPETIIVLETLDECLLGKIDNRQSDYFDGMKELLSAYGKKIYWVLEGAMMDSTNPESAMIYGMLRVARSENDVSLITCLDVAPGIQAAQIVEAMEPVLTSVELTEDEIAERNGVYHIPRLEMDDVLNGKLFNGFNRTPAKAPFKQDQLLQLKSEVIGPSRHFVFNSLPEVPLHDEEVEIEIKAARVTKNDSILAQQETANARFGGDCAGVIVKRGQDVAEFNLGDRVVALRPLQGSMGNRVRVPAALCRRLQDSENFDLATLWPTAVTMAYYALMHIARLMAGETVLIFSAESETGQSLIQVARRLGAKVYAVTNSAVGKAHLQELWPAMPTFTLDEITHDGKGTVPSADVILSNHGSQWGSQFLKLLSPIGRLVDYSDIEPSQAVGAIGQEPYNPSTHGASIASVNFNTLLEHRRVLVLECFSLAHDLVQKAAIQPRIDSRIFRFAQIQEAFDYLQKNTQDSEAVILTSEESEQVPISPPRFGASASIFSPEKVYLLVGGLSGLGLELAEWMTLRGARKLAFMSRSGAGRPGSSANAMLDRLTAKGVSSSVYRCDIADYTGVKQCIDSISAELGGIFHAAAVIEDSPLQQMSVSQWRRTITPKVQGADNLDRATADMKLDFFICFSSASAIVGTKAQASYVAGNAYMDALMRSRRQRGLSGTTINIGMVVGIGLVAADAKLEATMKLTGFDPVNEYEFFSLIEEAVRTGDSLATSNERNVDMYRIVTGTRVTGPQCFWYKKPLFKQLAAVFDEEERPTASSSEKQDLVPLLRAAKDIKARSELVMNTFKETLSRITGVTLENIVPDKSLVSYGLDSLVAMEIRNWFAKTLQVNVAVFEILGSGTIAALIARVVKDIPDSLLRSESTSDANAVAKKDTNSSSPKSVIDKIPRPQHIPMSSYQTRFWFMHQMAEDKSALNISVTMYMKGRLDIEALTAAFSTIRKQNEVLHTAFVHGDDFPEQVVVDKDAYEVFSEDLSSADSPEQAALARINQLRARELDIESGETVQITLLKLAADKYALVLIVHHIVTDRGSSKSFLDQLVALYNDAVGGKLQESSKAKTQYIDFTLWHERHLSSPEMRPHVDYWIDTFKDSQQTSALLPFSRPRPERQTFKTASLSALLDASLLARMKRVAARFNSTVPQFILSAFRLIHYRYTQQEDLTIHLVHGDRPHPMVYDTLGNYVNLLPIRHQLDSPDITFDAVVSQMQQRVMEAMEHGGIPFDVIVREAAVKRSSSHFPLGQLTFNYQSHGPMKNYGTQHFDIERYETVDIPTASEMSLEAVEDADQGLRFCLEYSQALYDAEDMHRFLDNFITCLTATIKDYRQPITEIPICGPAERALLEKSWFQSASDIDTQMDIVDIICKKSADSPSSVALTDSDGQSMTYSELLEASKKVAVCLQTHGAQPGDVIGLLATPSVHMLVGMMGILFNRCAYVAMDPDFPLERLQYMATDSNCSAILVDLEAGKQAQPIGPTLLNIRQAVNSPIRKAFELAPFQNNMPFYITYTSGSTGKPKGVVMRHSNAQPMLQDIQNEFHFDSQDRFLLATSICFDLSVLQIFTPLLVGATVCISTTTTRRDPLLLSQFMKDSGVTFTYFTPSQFAVLLEGAEDDLRDCQTWRTAFFCGEVLPPRLARQLYSLGTPAVVYNTYGPCEAMVQITLQQVDSSVSEGESISIGRPLAHSWCYVVDAGLNPVPFGVDGELCVGGPQVGDGYIARPKESRKAFHLDPFHHATPDQQATHIFRTGDLARMNRGGTIDYVGRQAGTTLVKLRGYRLDLQDIEQNILAEARTSEPKDVAAVCVLAMSPGTDTHEHSLADQRQLIAFLVLRDSWHANPDAVVSKLHHGLSKRLSNYMVPSAYHILSQLPQTIGGKTDRQRLLKTPLNLIYPKRHITINTKTEPDNELNAMSIYEGVHALFRSTLKLQPKESVEEHTSFFELGGHSVLLLGVQSAISRKFKAKVPLRDILDQPTPIGITELVCSTLRIPMDFHSQNASSTGTLTPLTPSDASEGSFVITDGNTTPGGYTPVVEKIDIAEKLKQGLSSQKQALSDQKHTYPIDWEEETLLPVEDRYHIPAGGEYPAQDKGADIFITGADTFVGIHFLAQVLSHSNATAHIIGTSSRISHASVINQFRKYDLLQFVSTGAVWSRVRCYHGDMTRPHFGLTDSEFQRLGARVQTIYNLGAYVSLIQTYSSLKSVNTRAILDIIELAACGPHVSEIHHLSTFSVPHLQTWTKSLHLEDNFSTAEEPPLDYRPSTSDDNGYIKARWAAEMLLTNASDRGFPVQIYRSSMPTASTLTQISQGDSGVIERIVTLMLSTGYVPKPQSGELDMAVDLVPVDIVASWLHALSIGAPSEGRLGVWHLTNPHPLPFKELANVIPSMVGGPGHSELLGTDMWIDKVGKCCGDSERDRLIWDATTGLLKEGHVMFQLDAERTHATLKTINGLPHCPPVDAEYLGRLMK
ncbi:uncharacterized protein BDW43DRAFT_306237 [Aspergillus alliaceus]|uniref:uncharacterized protein n=1 Tax=Petromyces alliaceus TaxID=209559 RepID=UPI0012A5523C|nr:uncharacterized protein BDW43DRAFT_306237 [Aspergillus alliaceus]KAB8238375.1 hypothetical protein BDW43DRAFT_306237 [Aspergillus alliaceus]